MVLNVIILKKVVGFFRRLILKSSDMKYCMQTIGKILTIVESR